MNSSIELMVSEHAAISRMLEVVRRMCCDILDGEAVDVPAFRNVIDFIRNYADRHHHRKEEDFLFGEMVSRLGKVAENLVTHGMMVEHDLGRGHVLALETALNLYEENPKTEYRLDILTEAMGYANLLKRHIEKENNVVYTFAERQLPSEVFETVNAACDAFEAEETAQGIPQKYLDMLEQMEARLQSGARIS